MRNTGGAHRVLAAMLLVTAAGETIAATADYDPSAVQAIEGDEHLPGLAFPVVEVLGRPVTPANLIARQFDEDYGGEHQQFDMIAFLDGQEADGIAVPAGLDAFRQSWRRPKWHVLVQNPPLAAK